MTMSASFSASALTVAPAAVNSESGRPDFTPAPGSTAISTPSALNFLIVSGVTATRGSDASISLATAIFIRPPAAQGPRVRKLVGFREVNTGLQPEQAVDNSAAGRRRDRDGSGEENRHQRND